MGFLRCFSQKHHFKWLIAVREKTGKENEQIHAHVLPLHQNLPSTVTPELSEKMFGNAEKPLQLVQLSCLTENPRHLKPAPKHSLTSLTPFVSLPSVFSHLLLQEFQDLAGFTEPIQCNIILFYFCLGIRWGLYGKQLSKCAHTGMQSGPEKACVHLKQLSET